VVLQDVIKGGLLFLALLSGYHALYALTQAEEQSLTSGVNVGITSVIDEVAENSPNAFNTKISFYTQTIGRTMAALDIGGKVYSGQDKEAAISAGMTLLSEWAGAEGGGKALLMAAGISTVSVNTAIMAIQVYRASEQALSSATNGRKLETLYGSIGSDPYLHSLNRNLGEGDPFPVTPETVDYVWKRVLEEGFGSWKPYFKVYVTEVLEEPWPESTLWAKWTQSAAVNLEAETLALKREEKVYKSYIAYLLRDMNIVAKQRESSVLARRLLSQISSSLEKLGSAQVIRDYFKAKARIPEVRTFIEKECPAYIRKSLSRREYDDIVKAITLSQSYRYDVLAFLPKEGKVGVTRKSLSEGLKGCKRHAEAARDQIFASQKIWSMQEASQQNATRWVARRVGFDLTIDALKAALRQEYFQNGTIDKSMEQVTKAWEEMRAGYASQSEVVMSVCTQEKSCESVEADAFFRQLHIYEKLDNTAYDLLNREIGLYMTALDHEVREREKFYADLFSELSHRRPIRYDDSKYRYIDWEAVDSIESYVGLTKLRLPPLRPDRYDSGIKDMSDDIFHLLYSVKGERERIGDEIKRVGRVAALELDDVQRAVEAYADLYQKTASVLASEEIVRLKERGLDRLGDYKKRLADYKRDVKKMIAAHEKARSLLPRLRQEYENSSNDYLYLSRIRTIISHYDETYHRFIKMYRHYRHNRRIDPRHFPSMSEDGRTPSCDALAEVATPYMRQKDLDEAQQRLRASLADIIWLDEAYQIGLEKALKHLYSYIEWGQHLAPEHYLVYAYKDDCFYVEKAQLQLLKRPLEIIKREAGSLQWEFKKEKEADYFQYFLETSSSKLDKSLKKKIRHLQWQLKVDNAYFTYIETLIPHIREKAMKAQFSQLLQAYKEAVTAYKEQLRKEAYRREQFEVYATLYAKMDRAAYDLNAANMKAQGRSTLLPLSEQLLRYDRQLLSFLDTRVQDTKLSVRARGSFAKKRDKMRERYRQDQEFMRNIENQKEGTSSERQIAQARGAITRFYEDFKAAYENKDAPSILSMLSSDWSSQDEGLRRSDLEANLNDSFSLFDEITVEISDIKIKSEGTLYRVTYNLDIKGYIYEDDISHEENSEVTELLRVDGSTVKIVKTVSGRFWYVR